MKAFLVVFNSNKTGLDELSLKHLVDIFIQYVLLFHDALLVWLNQVGSSFISLSFCSV